MHWFDKSGNNKTNIMLVAFLHGTSPSHHHRNSFIHRAIEVSRKWTLVRGSGDSSGNVEELESVTNVGFAAHKSLHIKKWNNVTRRKSTWHWDWPWPCCWTIRISMRISYEHEQVSRLFSPVEAMHNGHPTRLLSLPLSIFLFVWYMSQSSSSSYALVPLSSPLMCSSKSSWF